MWQCCKMTAVINSHITSFIQCAYCDHLTVVLFHFSVFSFSFLLFVYQFLLDEVYVNHKACSTHKDIH